MTYSNGMRLHSLGSFRSWYNFTMVGCCHMTAIICAPMEIIGWLEAFSVTVSVVVHKQSPRRVSQFVEAGCSWNMSPQFYVDLSLSPASSPALYDARYVQLICTVFLPQIADIPKGPLNWESRVDDRSSRICSTQYTRFGSRASFVFYHSVPLKPFGPLWGFSLLGHSCLIVCELWFSFPLSNKLLCDSPV